MARSTILRRMNLSDVRIKAAAEQGFELPATFDVTFVVNDEEEGLDVSLQSATPVGATGGAAAEWEQYSEDWLRHPTLGFQDSIGESFAAQVKDEMEAKLSADFWASVRRDNT